MPSSAQDTRAPRPSGRGAGAILWWPRRSGCDTRGQTAARFCSTGGRSCARQPRRNGPASYPTGPRIARSALRAGAVRRADPDVLSAGGEMRLRVIFGVFFWLGVLMAF